MRAQGVQAPSRRRPPSPRARSVAGRGRQHQHLSVVCSPRENGRRGLGGHSLHCTLSQARHTRGGGFVMCKVYTPEASRDASPGTRLRSGHPAHARATPICRRCGALGAYRPAGAVPRLGPGGQFRTGCVRHRDLSGCFLLSRPVIIGFAVYTHCRAQNHAVPRGAREGAGLDSCSLRLEAWRGEAGPPGARTCHRCPTPKA